MYELNEKNKKISKNGFLFDKINELIKKFYSNLSNISIHIF